MARKNELSSLVSQLGKTESQADSLFRRGSRKPPSVHELRGESLSSTGTHRGGIQFGSPSNNRVSQPQVGTSWTHLLRQTASGGLSNALGGSLFGAVGGLGGIVSGIVNLFGHHRKAPPPLTLFHLPESENQTVYVRSNAGRQTTPAAIYNSSHPQAFQYRSTEIANAVKHAMLNSSSLNDVIAEV